jgi:hypothetical protein
MYAPRLINPNEDFEPEVHMPRRMPGIGPTDVSDPFDVYRRESGGLPNPMHVPPSRNRYLSPAHPNGGHPLRNPLSVNGVGLPGYTDPERHSIHTETRSNQAFGSIKHLPPSEFADRTSQFGLEGVDTQLYNSECP